MPASRVSPKAPLMISDHRRFCATACSHDDIEIKAASFRRALSMPQKPLYKGGKKANKPTLSAKKLAAKAAKTKKGDTRCSVAEASPDTGTTRPPAT